MPTPHQGLPIDQAPLPVDATLEGEPRLLRQLTRPATWVAFLVPLGILAFLAAQIDLKAAWGTLRQASPWAMLGAVCAYYLSFPLRGHRWRQLLERTGVKVPGAKLGELVFLSYFANSILPVKLGDLYRAHLLRRNYGPKVSTALGSIVAERLLDLVVLACLFAGAGLVVLRGRVAAELELLLWIGAGAAVLGLVVLLAGRRWLPAVVARLPVPRRFRGSVGRLAEAFATAVGGRVVLPVTAITLATWLLEALRLQFVLWSLDVSMGLGAVIVTAFAASLLTVIPYTPAGLGAVEAGMVGLLSLFGVGLDVAVAVTLLDRLVSFWLLLVLGGATIALTPRKVV